MKLNIDNKGFTLVETLIVVVIIAIIAMIAVPMTSSAGSMKLKSAANIIAADLEYAKSLAIGSQQFYSIQFDVSTESYSILDKDGVVIENSLKPGSNYTVDLTKESRFSGLDVQSVDFDGSGTITFDYLGSPYSGLGLSTPMNSGSVTIAVNGSSVQVVVEPVTGYVRTVY